jgi:hypothetical protein
MRREAQVCEDRQAAPTWQLDAGSQGGHCRAAPRKASGNNFTAAARAVKRTRRRLHREGPGRARPSQVAGLCCPWLSTCGGPGVGTTGCFDPAVSQAWHLPWRPAGVAWPAAAQALSFQSSTGALFETELFVLRGFGTQTVN